MTKTAFLDELKKGLSGLLEEDIIRSIEFYSEMIDDRIEDGKNEEEAVADMGSLKDVISRILSETPMSRLIKEKVRPKRKIQAWEIVLLALGSPIWISIIVALFSVVAAVYVSIWSVEVALWSIFAALAGGALGGIGAGVIFICTGNLLPGIAMIGASFACSGFSIFMFFGCVESTKRMTILTKNIVLLIKKCFVKKEVAQ